MSLETLSPRIVLDCTVGVGGGDFNSNGICDAGDIEILSAVVRAGTGNSTHDLNLDGMFDQEDRRIWIQDRAQTWYGDVDINQRFDANDLAAIELAGEYVDAVPANSTWNEGDFTGDADVDRFDLVAAFQAGGYNRGKYPGPGVSLPVPQASSLVSDAALPTDEGISLVYDPLTGRLGLRTREIALTSISIDSAAGWFSSTSQTDTLLSGVFDLANDTTMLKIDAAAFMDLQWGAVLPSGLSEIEVLEDITVMGSRQAGGDLGLVYLDYLSPLDADEPANDTRQGSYELSAAEPIATDRSLDHRGDEDWYQWTAIERGQLSAELFFSADIGNAELELYDGTGKLLARSSTETDNEHLSYAVLPGETYFVRVYGYRHGTVSDYDLAVYLVPEAARVYVLTDQQVRIFDPGGLEELVPPIDLPIAAGDRVGDIEMGAHGLLYVSVDPLDSTTGEILELTPAGHITRRFVLPSDAGSVQYPRGFDVLADGSFLVSQPNARRVVQVDASGLIRGIFPQLGSKQFPVDATVTADQQVVWSAATIPQLGRPPSHGYLISPNEFGGYWTADPNLDRLERRDASGSVVQQITATDPRDVQEGADGSLFYVNATTLTKRAANLQLPPESQGVPGAVALAVSDGEFSVREIQPLRDRDGDGLPDEWEENGLDVNGDGTIDLDLPALGADPDHKDLFVEVDAMQGRAPLPSTLDRVVQAFADVPASLVFNPDGQPGINLHLIDYAVEYSGQLADVTIPRQSFSGSASDIWQDVHQLKTQYLGSLQDRQHPNAEQILAAKQLVFRYALFGDTQGHQGAAGSAEVLGENLLITLGSWSTPGGTSQQQAAVFMHYLGRMLGLQPGGQDGVPYKSNYLSVMNFAHADGNTLLNDAPFLDYSRYSPTARQAEYRNVSLDENSLDETVGLGFPAGIEFSFQLTADQFADSDEFVDWDNSGSNNDTGIVFDLNYTRAGELHHSYNDWGDLDFGLEANTDPDFSVDDPVDGKLISDVCENFYPASDADAFECNDDKENASPLGSTDFDTDLTLHSSSDEDWFEIQANLGGLIVFILDAIDDDPGFIPPVDVDIMKDEGDGCVEVDVTPSEIGTARQYEVSTNAGDTILLHIFGEDEGVSFANYRLVVQTPDAVSSWTGAGADDSWANADNWLDHMVPSPLVDIEFPVTDGYQSVNLQGDRDVGSVQFTSDYQINGGDLNMFSPQLSVASNAAVTFDVPIDNSQTIQQSGGGTVRLNQTAGAWSVQDGRLEGTGTVAELTVGVGTTLAPGNSVGTMQVDDFALVFGSLTVEVQVNPFNAAVFQSDLLSVGNAVSLAPISSGLDVHMLGPAGMTGEFSVPIIEAGAMVVGSFGVVPSLDEHLGSGVFFHDVVYSGSTVSLLLFQAQPGDANGDGLFNSDDLIEVLAAGKYETGQTDADWTTGDWNGDGLFDTDDLIEALQTGTYEADAAYAAVSPLVTTGVAAALAPDDRQGTSERPTNSLLPHFVQALSPQRSRRLLDPLWVDAIFSRPTN